MELHDASWTSELSRQCYFPHEATRPVTSQRFADRVKRLNNHEVILYHELNGRVTPSFRDIAVMCVGADLIIRVKLVTLPVSHETKLRARSEVGIGDEQV